ncbi:MAG: hypothetical protein KBS59_05175 [Clostridiales bacterium]|nr:hypothetical protein [Clostridiales bacterium]
MKEKTLAVIKKFLPPVLVLAFVIYVIYQLFCGFFAPDELYLVKSGELEKTVLLDGYIFRDESVIFSREGDFITTAENGKRIPAGSVVATLKDDGGVKVISEKAGYFYDRTDGYENAFSSGAALSLTAGNFDAVVSQKPEKYEYAIGKTAVDFCFYFACKTENFAGFALGDIYEFSFDGTKLPMTLARVDGDGKCAVLVFRCDTVRDDFAFSRQMSASVTVKKYPGDVVPKDAVKTERRLNYVYVFDDGFAIRKRVNVIYDDGELCVVEAESTLDGKFIVMGKNLYDGKVMK